MNKKLQLPLYAQRSILALALLMSLLSLAPLDGAMPVQAQSTGMYQNLLSGKVVYQGSTDPVPDGARVIAWQDVASLSGGRQYAQTSAGAYSLLLGGGAWQVTVLPPKVSTTSPDYVYTGGPQLVTFNGNPDPAGVQTLNFEVRPATATITGRVVPPPDIAQWSTTGCGTLSTANCVFVTAADSEGNGNTVQVTADGSFTLKVLPGSVKIHLWISNPKYGEPADLAGSIYFTSDTVPLNLGDLTLQARSDQITGTVLKLEGGAAAGVIVRAWRIDGTATYKTSSDTSGFFSLAVTPGLWAVRAQQSTDPQASPYYISPESPVIVAAPSASPIILHVTVADVTLNGRIVDAKDSTKTLVDAFGAVWPTYLKDGKWIQVGEGQPVAAGLFTLKVSSHVASVYRLHSALKGPYTAAAAPEVTLDGSPAQDVTIPAAGNNSVIQGTLFLHGADTPTPALGVPGKVYAVADDGAWDADQVNPLTARYRLNVATTDTAGNGGTFWWVHAFVDPSSGYAVLRPRTQKTFLAYNNGNGDTQTVNFEVAKITGAITGMVTDPQGVPVRGARVTAVEQALDASGAYRQSALTDAEGKYALKVPAGIYKVSATFTFMNMMMNPLPGWISPLPITVTVKDGDTATADLQFRARNAVISGVVTAMINGTPTSHKALVRALSESGARAFTLAGADGAYLLPVASGEIWKVQAVAEIDGQFYASPRVAVDVQAKLVTGINLKMVAVEVMPKISVFTFPADQDQALTLSNGAQVIVPAGALADSGNVTLTALPLAEIADAGEAQPVSFGYRLLAFDQYGMPIHKLNQAATLRIPFTAQQLKDLGVTPAQLVPCYWDEATQSWVALENYTVEVNADGSGWVNVTVMHFTDFASLASAPSAGLQQLYLPLMAR